VNVLRWPAVGALLRWRHARTLCQLVLLFVAALVVIDGLTGPAFAPANLATTLTWVHYRGLLVLALLAAGNVFCLGCPMVRMRDWARRLHAPVRRLPKPLRTKWVGVALFAAVLVGYEWFDWWALPAATAGLVLAYFGAALVVDLTFSGASFCKYVCPIGQFNFVASTMSPFEMRVERPEVCAACRTHDCIKGRVDAGRVQRGCELGLFLPAKVGNLDCTFCLDCAHACPHDNVALAPRAPGLELAAGGRRSGLGRLGRRADVAALVVLFTFGGLVNAAAMTGPVQHLPHQLGWPEDVVLAAMFVAALIVLPLVLLTPAATATRWLAADTRSAARLGVRYVFALVPLGFAVWLAHYGFHFLTGALGILPAVQRAASDVFGPDVFGLPAGLPPGLPPGAVLPIEVGVIVLGAMGAIALALAIAREEHPSVAGRAAAPWMGIALLLGAGALWIVNLPMDMRGMDMGAGLS
jgi:ferredoxin